MKKGLFSKAISMMAMGLVVASCGNDSIEYDPTLTQAQEEAKSAQSFVQKIMNGQGIDSEQNFNTAVAAKVDVNIQLTDESCNVYLFTEDPLSVEAPAYLAKAANVNSDVTLHFAKPQNCNTLYAAAYTNNGGVRVAAFDMKDTEGNVTIKAASDNSQTASKPNRERRKAAAAFAFPAAPADADFVTAVPADVKPYKEVGQWGYPSGVSYVDETVSEVNIWGNWDGTKTSGGTLYIKGRFAPTKFYIAPNSNIYLCEGAEFILPEGGNGSENLQGGCNFYIPSGAKIVTSGHLVLNNGLRIYNRGSIEAAKVSVNNTSVLYNEGELKDNGELSVENSNSVIVNDGTITATRLHTAGSGHVQNNYLMTISGNTDIDSNNNTWVNNGTYTTENFFYTAGSCDVINNCRLTVNELFKINLGDTDANGFRNDTGAGVVTKSFLMEGPAYIHQGAGAIFKVEEDATMKATKAYYGIYGPDNGDYAVFQAKNIIAGAENQGYLVTYGGRLGVASDTHFAQGYSGTYPYYEQGANVVMASTQTGLSAELVKIDATECSPGYNGGVTPPVPTPSYCYYAYEDLGTYDDFDFNDVVLRVSSPDENGTSTIELLATGGTLETYVRLNGVQIGGEVHAELGKPDVDNDGEYTMINHQTVDTSLFKVIGKAENVTDPSDLPLTILVKKTNGISTEVGAKDKGKAPLMLRASGNEEGKWFWATERTNINDAYELFPTWAGNHALATDWYLTPTDGAVVNY